MAKTPMMEQYEEIKKNYQDMILFFRVGDFYETFYEDAKIISNELNLVLTSRGYDNDEQIPLAGVPFHSIENYILKLVKRGYKIAICDQVEDPKDAKGIVKREVTRVITPGVITETNFLDENTNNYLAAINYSDGIFGLAYIDISTADFFIIEFKEPNAFLQLCNELARILPSELLVSNELFTTFKFEFDFKTLTSKPIVINKFDETLNYDYEVINQFLCEHFNVKSLNGFGLNFENYKVSLVSAYVILKYLYQTQKCRVTHIKRINLITTSQYMQLDVQSRNALDILSLFNVLNFTKTSMGARLLKSWLESPLYNVDEIKKRQNLVEEFYNNTLIRKQIIDYLKEIYDIERIMSKIALKVANPKDIIALKKSLIQVDNIITLIKQEKNSLPLTFNIINEIFDFKDIVNLIEKAIIDDPPTLIREGGFIKKGYNQELDELIEISKNSQEWLLNFEQNEQKRSGIKSLKVKYNKVFGYYIEITKANLDLIPKNYIRKQTLANAERFYTPELKEMETKILNSYEQRKELEAKLFMSLLDDILKYIDQIYYIAKTIAKIDAIISYAEAAHKYNYVKPEVTCEDEIEIIGGRHPVVENYMKYTGFIENDTIIGGKHPHVLILTGPNMAGKSTYIRQVALITLMAQAGSFVSAKSAKIGICDRIFTRIGASDNLNFGQSTFMVEMVETANILNNATSKSLIILDEIGRGTSTYDGLAIAYSVIEYILSGAGRFSLGSKTLFATHYHELTILDKIFSKVQNLNVAVSEGESGIVFLHKILPGPAGKSYGIHVAKIAGLPQTVIERAEVILKNFEESNEKQNITKTLKKVSGVSRILVDENQLDLFENQINQKPKIPQELVLLIKDLKEIDVNKLTPIAALNILDDILKKVKTLNII